MTFKMWVKRWGARLWASRRVRRRLKKTRPALWMEQLEDRIVPVTINWVGEGTAADGFDAAFGAQAGAARKVVDAAIHDWKNVILDFGSSPPSQLANNTANITISAADPSTVSGLNANFVGGSGGIDGNKQLFVTIYVPKNNQITSTDSQGNPTSTPAWWMDPTPFDNSEFSPDSTPSPQKHDPSFAWTPDPAKVKGFDLLSEALHEVGHALQAFHGIPPNLQLWPGGQRTLFTETPYSPFRFSPAPSRFPTSTRRTRRGRSTPPSPRSGHSEMTPTGSGMWGRSRAGRPT
jgi:hypothetical protein